MTDFTQWELKGHVSNILFKAFFMWFCLCINTTSVLLEPPPIRTLQSQVMWSTIRNLWSRREEAEEESISEGQKEKEIFYSYTQPDIY